MCPFCSQNNFGDDIRAGRILAVLARDADYPSNMNFNDGIPTKAMSLDFCSRQVRLEANFARKGINDSI
jgi:hypothetical protein